jgi:hypothetical protein
MRKNYTQYLLIMALLMSLSAKGFSQKAIALIGNGPDMTNFASEQEIFDNLTAWGYAPEYWSTDDLALLEYDLYDGIFICESVGSSSVNSIASDGYMKPIVTLEGWSPRAERWDWINNNETEFYQTPSASGTVDDNIIVIMDNSHYITEIFSVNDEVPWSANSGEYDQTDIRTNSWAEVNQTYTAKLAVNKRHLVDQPTFWNMVAIDETDLPNKVFMWGIVQTGLDGDGTANIAAPEFFTILERACAWAYDDAGGSTAVRDLSSESFELAAFPNPAEDQLVIRFRADKSGEAIANLYGITGQLIDSFNRNAVTGKNFIELRVSDYASGVYHIELEMEGRKEYLKVVIQ